MDSSLEAVSPPAVNFGTITDEYDDKKPRCSSVVQLYCGLLTGTRASLRWNVCKRAKHWTRLFDPFKVTK